jgi:glycogen debranching enzyme
MSFYDYQASRAVDADTPFYALIMAAMRRADSGNLALLREAWPDVWAELEARYNAPGGVLADDAEYGRAQAQQREWLDSLGDCPHCGAKPGMPCREGDLSGRQAGRN